MTRIETVQTLVILAVVFIIANVLFKADWCIYVSLILLLLSLFENPVAGFIAKYWMLIAKKIGNFNSVVILGFIYFVFLTPIAIIFRVFNKESVRKFKHKRDSSYFEHIDKEYDREIFEKVW